MQSRVFGQILPTMLLVTSKWPICSTITTRATGTIVKITDQSKVGVVTVGRERKSALAMFSVFTSFRK